MNRAVEQSKFTLAILSPAYLESGFTELENLMAEHIGLETGQNRLIVLLREKCQPRISIRIRLWLDMTDDDLFEMSIVKLIEELKEKNL